jgi:mono/diheme cytochrome c family protein
MKQVLMFVVFVAVILGLFFALSTEKPPFLPTDEAHLAALAAAGPEKSPAPCGVCHAPGQSAPLGATHPPKEQCLRCHKKPRPAK